MPETIAKRDKTVTQESTEDFSGFKNSSEQSCSNSDTSITNVAAAENTRLRTDLKPGKQEPYYFQLISVSSTYIQEISSSSLIYILTQEVGCAATGNYCYRAAKKD